MLLCKPKTTESAGIWFKYRKSFPDHMIIKLWNCDSKNIQDFFWNFSKIPFCLSQTWGPGSPDCRGGGPAGLGSPSGRSFFTSNTHCICTWSHISWNEQVHKTFSLWLYNYLLWEQQLQLTTSSVHEMLTKKNTCACSPSFHVSIQSLSRPPLRPLRNSAPMSPRSVPLSSIRPSPSLHTAQLSV